MKCCRNEGAKRCPPDNTYIKTIQSGIVEFESDWENVGRGFKIIIKCLNGCELNPCGYGKCSNTIGGFSCDCPDGFIQGEGTEQCQTCESGFKLGDLDFVNMQRTVESWKEARDICSNYGDGSYTLPVPDSVRYNDYISNLVSGDTEIPLGFSDKLEEGNWINVYTSESINK